MELRELRAFLAAVEELHFGRAARRLHLTQSALSKRIRRLESELGCPLFRRAGRDVGLSAGGRALVDRARQILALADDCPRLVRGAEDGKVGTLDVAYAPSADIRILPVILRRFRRRHPSVDVRLRSACTPQLLEDLRAERLDVGFVHMPAQSPSVAIEPICREPLVLGVPKGHPLARQPRVGLRQLDTVPFVFFPRAYAPVYHDLVTSLAREAGVLLRIETEARSVHDAISLIAAGQGVSLLPAAVQDTPRKGVTYRRLENPEPQIETGLAWKPQVRSRVRDLFTRCVRHVYRVGPQPRTCKVG